MMYRDRNDAAERLADALEQWQGTHPLVIAGRHDRATPPEHGERIAAGIPGARMELVDAAHLATIEQPQVMTDLIAGHLLA